MKKIVMLILPVCVAMMTGCASSPTRIQAGGATALTTMSVDLADFKDAAGQIVQGMLVNQRLSQFPVKNGGRLPVVAVGGIVNKSDKAFDLGQIAGRINEDLLNSGIVEIMADDSGSKAASAEDAFMNDTKVNTDSRADFYIEGSIMLLQARDGRTREKTYTFQLKLNDRNRRTVFQRSVDVAKQGTKSAVGW